VQVRRLSLCGLLAALALVGPGSASGDNPQLFGTVEGVITITFLDANGVPVTQLDPGTYDIVVHDRSDQHNFHLSGPGVDLKTETNEIVDVTWTVTFVEGRYVFQCDPHSGMLGRFVVGNPPPPAAPPPPPTVGPGRLLGQVNDKFEITLRSARGANVGAVKGGAAYTIAVRDRSAEHNFHLAGPGVNRTTPVKKRQTVTWRVRFRKGARYAFYCDPHREDMRGAFVAR
jgi:plastocyanin